MLQTGTLQQALVNVTPDDAKRSIFGDLMNDFPYALNSARLYLERVEYPRYLRRSKIFEFFNLKYPAAASAGDEVEACPGDVLFSSLAL